MRGATEMNIFDPRPTAYIDVHRSRSIRTDSDFFGEGEDISKCLEQDVNCDASHC